MSLAVFTYIYESLLQYFGNSWLVWVILFITMLAVFGALLRVPFIVLGVIATIPFLLLALYAAIQVQPWIMFSILFLLGILLAISIWKLLTR